MQFQKDQSGKGTGAGRAIVQACVHAGLEAEGVVVRDVQGPRWGKLECTPKMRHKNRKNSP